MYLSDEFGSALAPDFWFMIMGRFLVGIGLGIGAPVSALYVSEVDIIRMEFASCRT